MFAFGKNKDLLHKLENYLEVAMETLEIFSEAMEYVIKDGIDEHFRVLAEKTHQYESKSNDIRRSIELDMYQNSLLPESREDLLVILEIIDKVPSQAEHLLYSFITEKTKIFPEIKDEMKELLKISVETFKYTIEATRNCFGKRDKIKELSDIVDGNESIGDQFERKMLTKIFDSSLKTSGKILQKEIVKNLGHICNLCEQTLDRIVICSVKREL